jgi:hypothetical protein
MTRPRFTWRRRAQFALVHWASRPLHGTFKRLPRLEAGLSRVEVSRIECGHSHGGQWRFDPLPLFWLPYGCNRRAAGLYVREGHRLYVNCGLGWALLPIRVNRPPEIFVVDWTG